MNAKARKKIAMCKSVIASGNKVVIAAMRSGDVSVSEAYNLVRRACLTEKLNGMSGKFLGIGRGKNADLEQLDRQIYTVLAPDPPQCVRYCMYRMTESDWPVYVPKTDDNSKKGTGLNNGYRAVQRRIKHMRRDGIIPYHWIADFSRSGYFTNTYLDTNDFMRSITGLYRSDLWRHSDHYVEVWTESRSIASVILGTCQELAVPLYPTGGYSSISLAVSAAGEIVDQTYNGKRSFELLYIGDYDPHGQKIPVALECELRRHLPDHIEMNIHRIAVNYDQIAEYGLATKPSKDGTMEETVEAEGVNAKILRNLIREKAESFLPPHQVGVTQAAEESERNYLEQWVDIMSDHTLFEVREALGEF